jgi:hypothetical protein
MYMVVVSGLLEEPDDRPHLHDLAGFSNEASKKTGSHK